MGEHTISKKKKKQKKEKDSVKEKVEAEEEMAREDEIEMNGEDNEEEKAQVTEEPDVDDSDNEVDDDVTELQKNASRQSSPTIPTSESRLPFTSFPLSPSTLRALSSLSLTTATPIQSACLPPLLAGKDLLGAAPKRSFPARRGGKQADWMGVAVEK